MSIPTALTAKPSMISTTNNFEACRLALFRNTVVSYQCRNTSRRRLLLLTPSRVEGLHRHAHIDHDRDLDAST